MGDDVFNIYINWGAIPENGSMNIGFHSAGYIWSEIRTFEQNFHLETRAYYGGYQTHTYRRNGKTVTRRHRKSTYRDVWVLNHDANIQHMPLGDPNQTEWTTRRVVGMLTNVLEDMGEAQGEIDFLNLYVPKDERNRNLFDQNDPIDSSWDHPVHETYSPYSTEGLPIKSPYYDVTKIVTGSQSRVRLKVSNPKPKFHQNIYQGYWDEEATNVDIWGNDDLKSYFITFWDEQDLRQVARLAFDSSTDRLNYIKNTYDAARLKTFNKYFNKHIRRRASEDDISKWNRYNQRKSTKERPHGKYN